MSDLGLTIDSPSPKFHPGSAAAKRNAFQVDLRSAADASHVTCLNDDISDGLLDEPRLRGHSNCCYEKREADSSALLR